MRQCDYGRAGHDVLSALVARPSRDVHHVASLGIDLLRVHAAAKSDDGTLRYVASVSKDKIAVGLQTVDRASPFFGLKGTDNQVAFTTARYRKNPLVITGPGAGPAVTAAGVLNDLLRLT